MQSRIEPPHFPADRIVVLDQRLLIIQQHLVGNATKSKERTFQSFEPVGLPLSQRGSDMYASRVTQRCDKHVHPKPLTGDPYARLAKVDLQLATWWNFEPNCRTLLCLQLPSPLPNSKLYRTQADDNSVLARQLLADYIRIAVMTEKAFSQPIVQPVKRTAPNRFLEKRHAAFPQISANRVARARKFLGQPLGTQPRTCSRNIATTST